MAIVHVGSLRLTYDSSVDLLPTDIPDGYIGFDTSTNRTWLKVAGTWQLGGQGDHEARHRADAADQLVLSSLGGFLTDTQHGARGAITNAHSHADLAGVSASQHHTAFVQADHDALANPHHSSSNDPTSGEKAALPGTSGVPSGTNKYVTDADSRNTDSRAPTGTASGELGGTYPAPTVNATHSGSAHHAQAHDHSAAGDGTTLAPATLNLPSGTAPTAEGRINWDTTNDKLVVGDGAATRHIVSTAAFSGDATVSTSGAMTVAATHAGSAHHAESHTLASHSAKAHSDLTGIGATDHHSNANDHPQSHGAADHSGDVIPAANQDFGAFYSDIAQIAAPANPASGTRRIFVDSADGKLKVRTSGGSNVSLEEQGGGSVPTGTGFRHVTGGVEDAASKLVDTADINDDQVTYAKIQDVSATDRVLGRDTAGAGVIEELTPTAVTALLDVFTSTLKGLAPSSGGGTTNFLRADGTWAEPAGGGGGETTVRATGDTANSTTSLADAVGLSFSASANSEYWIRADIHWTTSGTAVGIKLSADFSSTGHTMGGQWVVNAANGTLDGAAFNADDVTVTTAASPFTGPNTAFLQCFLKTGANAGTWVVRFAAETTGTITIKTGSIIRWQKTL